MKNFLRVLAIVLVVTAFSDAMACGESLYRIGKGVAYRAYTAPLPGNLLVYAESEEGREMAQQLANSGHGVQLVRNEAELAHELKAGGYDIVIAPESQAKTVANSGSTMSFIEITTDKSDKAHRTIAADSNIKQYLKTIHRTLKAKDKSA